MSPRRKTPAHAVSQLDDDNFNLCLTWIARILLMSSFFSRSLSKIRRLDDEVQEALGLEAYDLHAHKISELRVRIKESLCGLEAKRPAEPGVLYKNTMLLQKTFGFSDAEAEIFAFVAAANVYQMLRDVVEPLNEATPEQIIQTISAATKLPVIAVKKAFSSEAPLGSSGLVRVGKTSSNYNDHPFKLIDTLALTILSHHDVPESLLAKCFRKAEETSLAIGNFSHLEGRLEILKRYLAKRLEAPRQGVNILLYGAPGVGKTELARVMAKSLNASLYEVLVQDDDGDARSPNERLSSYRMCQSVLKQKPRSVVLFDEVEDVFPVESFFFFGPSRHSRGDKGYMVNLLENNKVPTIWIANQISQIDDSYLRRFDLLFEIKVPPRQVREQLLAEKFSALAVRPEWIDKMSKAEQITPSDVERAAKILEAIGGEEMEVNEQLTEEILKSNLGARRLSLASPRTGCGESVYDLSYLNTTENIGRTAEGLARQLKGSVLLYGAPGTGKTAFAHHIGELAKKPVLIRRASDLLNMYVGGTEANIAKMFLEAEAEQSILLLDEADSFFRDRRIAQRSWEVTQVNELLVQMESFSGLFICSTNLMDNLDQAVFRRFALKIRFDYPNGEQRWRLFLAHAKELGLILDQDAIAIYRTRIDRLSHVAPGDFATVRRKHELLGNLSSLESLIDALAEECKVKPDVREEKNIGFQS